MVPPKPPPPTISNGVHASLEEIITAAHQASPHGRLNEISDPSLIGSMVHAYMDLRGDGDFSHRDIVTIDASNAHVLTVWHYGQNQTLGDWIVWSMFPFPLRYSMGFLLQDPMVPTRLEPCSTYRYRPAHVLEPLPPTSLASSDHSAS